MKEVMDRQAEEELGASKLQRVKTVIFSPGKAWKSMEKHGKRMEMQHDITRNNEFPFSRIGKDYRC